MTRRVKTLSKNGPPSKMTVTFQRNQAKTNCVLNKSKILISETGGEFEMLQFSARSELEIFKPMPFKVYFRGHGFELQNESLDVFSSDKSFKKALADMELQIAELWNDFAAVDESQLSSSGKVIQKFLLAHVRQKRFTKNIYK